MWRNNYLINIDELVKRIAMEYVLLAQQIQKGKSTYFMRMTWKHKSNTFSNIAEVLTLGHNCHIELDLRDDRNEQKPKRHHFRQK